MENKLNREELNLVLYAIAKMMDTDGRENKEMWKELFLKLNDKKEKLGCPITLGEYENNK